MSNHNCLNCGQPIVQNYCANCGQRASTHRFSLRHLLEHDIIHGIFHLDKGFLFTAKELLTRPGYSIREYVDGKRVKHFNAITFILLTTAFYLFLMHTADYDIMDTIGTQAGKQSGKPTGPTAQDYVNKYMKQYYMILIPFWAGFTYLFFPRARQNYAEHLVLNAYKECGNTMINILVMLVVIISQNNTVAFIALMSSAVLSLLYGIWFYRQYFSKDYRNKTLLTIRIMLMQGFIMAFTLGLAMAGVYIYAFFIGGHVVWQGMQATIVK